jgi:hypothetical protein
MTSWIKIDLTTVKKSFKSIFNQEARWAPVHPTLPR